jgi:hypothetical protein
MVDCVWLSKNNSLSEGKGIIMQGLLVGMHDLRTYERQQYDQAYLDNQQGEV